MWEKNLNQRLILIGAVLLVGIWLITPPSEKLRGGQDIEGGVSMIFEIQEEEGVDEPYLAERMKQLLMKRVDPRGVYDLRWRVLGSNRLEVQMPLPPDENKGLRQAFLAAREKLAETNIKRGDLESALRLTGPERDSVLKALAADSAERERLLREAAQVNDEWVRALQELQDAQAATQPAEPATQPVLPQLRLALRDAEESRDDAIGAVLDMNFPMVRFQEVLEMEEGTERRENSIKEWIGNRGPEGAPGEFENLEPLIVAAIDTHKAWRAKRTYLESPADLRRLLRGAGVLEFRILAEPATSDNPTQYDRYRQQLRERGPRPQEGDSYQWFRIDNPLAFFDLNSPKELETFDYLSSQLLWVVDKYEGDEHWYVLAKRGSADGLLREPGAGPKWRLKSAGITRDSAGRRAVSFNLDPIGGSIFSELTGNNKEKQLCILVDDVAYSSARIQSRISTSGIITGDFSLEKINYLVQTLEAGSLPARLKDTPLSERTIGSSLGHQNLSRAFQAGVAGVIAVAIVMIIYYLTNGLIANVALLMNIVLVLAAMAMLGARFTLAGIAGVILTIGMTVDANVLIFERMREEKARGSSLRMVIKNGYEKAFSTIIDANITTLLICVIIYYVGSEEIKGFGLTLGWGIVTSLFTALFVTRTVFTLLIKYNLIKDIKMLHLIGVPNIDWYGKRKFFIPLSFAVVVIGMILLVDRGVDALDVEFRGGVNAEVALKPEAAGEYDDIKISGLLRQIGAELSADGAKLANTQVTPVPGDPTAFRVAAPDVSAARLAAMIAEPLEAQNLLQRGGVDTTGGEFELVLRGSDTATAESLQTAIRALGTGGDFSIAQAGNNIAKANIGLVTETGEPGEVGRYWNITTTETNKALVQYALVSAFGGDLEIQPRITYVFHGEGGQPYPITERQLIQVIPNLPAGVGGNLTDHLGGAAIYFDQLSPPQTRETIYERLRNMRLQPDYESLAWRNFEVIPVSQADADDDGQGDVSPEGQPLLSGVVIAVSDQNISYEEDRDVWLAELAQPELGLAKATFDKEQTLRKVTQFKPQIADQSKTKASVALVLSWAVIIGYLWIRFGRPSYGIAGVVALIHDVLIALAFVGISGWLGGVNHPIGNALLINDFKIDMTIVAAFLTIIGYSINDTIVVFDRIRETRGRMGIVSPQIINQSINQCLSRTLLTSATTFLVLLVMYIFGGSSIRGFNYCMMIGVITGTYSSIAVAAPLLMARFGGQRATAPAR